MKLYPYFLCLLAGLVMLACSDPDEIETVPPPSPVETQYTFAKFDVTTGNPADIPVPNDILRNPVTGQNAVPVQGEPFDSLNSLSGFSTTAPIVMPFTGTVDADSVNGQTILVLNTQTMTPAAVSFQVATNPETGNSTVFATPITPLEPGVRYAVVITGGVMGQPSNLPVESDAITLLLKGEIPFVDENGHSTRGALTDAQAQQLEPLRASMQPLWQAAEAVTGQDRIFIPLVFAFSTQPLHSTLPALHARIQNEAITPTVLQSFEGAAAVDAFFTAAGLGAAPHDQIASVRFGSFNAPHYLHHPFNGPFQGSGADVVEAGRENLQFILTMPVTPAAALPPVIVFQHGITRSKEDMLAFANSAATAGFATIGIDLVLHGSRVKDIINNETGAFEPDGVPDPSGANFINLVNMRMSRDNVRQSAADLFSLTRMITSGQTDFNQDGAPDLAPVELSYVGQSLGAIVGSVFVSNEAAVKHAVLNVGGGRVPYLLRNSASFAPAINAGLAAQGVVPGTADYELFFLIAQTVFDDADPMNNARHLLSGALSGGVSTSVLVQEMIGDQVVPNSATRDMVRSIGLPLVNGIEEVAGLPMVDAPHAGSGYYQYQDGGHSFLLSPTAGPTAQAHFQVLTFLGGSLQGSPVVVNPFASGKLPLDAGMPGETNEIHPFVIALPR